MANRNLSPVILLGGLSVNLNHLKTAKKRRTERVYINGADRLKIYTRQLPGC